MGALLLTAGLLEAMQKHRGDAQNEKQAGDFADIYGNWAELKTGNEILVGDAEPGLIQQPSQAIQYVVQIDKKKRDD